MGKRRCDGSWFDTFFKWTMPRSEAPKSFLFWAGAFTLSSILKRNVSIPKELMGSYEVFPNLYVLFVGPPGGPRKSTTMNYTYALLKDLKLNLSQAVNFASTAMSDSKLVQVLSETDDGTVTILSSEFSSFVNVSQETMFDLLTDLYDGKVSHEYSTRTHGVELVDKPCVNLLAATTPSWISTASAHLAGGGFASRIIFVYENEVRQRRLYYDDVDWGEMAELERDLRLDLKEIGDLRGEFKHESRAVRDEMEDWYRTHARKDSDVDERVMGYFQRKHVHVHKLSMLFSVAEDDSLLIKHHHFQKALEVFEETEKKMHRALTTIGKNPYAGDMERIVDFIQSLNGKGAPRSLLIRKFYHNLEVRQLDELLDSLVGMGDLSYERESGEKLYYLPSEKG